MNIKKYIKGYKIYKDCDLDFWGILHLHDLEEVDNNVRYCFAIYEPIN